MEVIIDGVRYVPEQKGELIKSEVLFKWGKSSLERMNDIHPDLRKVLNRVIQITPIDLTVLEGRRTIDRQRQLVKNGASRTMKSRHLTGHAVDIAPLDEQGHISWDWPLYHIIAEVMFVVAAEVGVSLEWGGDWKDFKDGPHWQLPWDKYPA